MITYHIIFKLSKRFESAVHNITLLVIEIYVVCIINKSILCPAFHIVFVFISC